jgi:two-component system, LytTR family, response regulator
MIDAIIVDDETRSCDVLSKMLKLYCPDVIVKGSAHNIEMAKKLIETEKPRLVFLDIELPDGNSFLLLDELEQIDFRIIFITAFSDFAIRAFKCSAIDYLLKPLNIDELVAAIEKFKQSAYEGYRYQQLAQLKENINPRAEKLKTIGLSTLTEIRFVNIEDIIRLEASNNYTCFHMADGEKITVSHTIKYYEELLQDNHFMRVHQSHIINLGKVNKYQKGKSGSIVMNNGDTIHIAAQKKEPLLKALTGGWP